jgi:integrase
MTERKSTKRRKRAYRQGRVFKRGGVWWVSYCTDGEERRESSRSRAYADAVDLLKQRSGQQVNGTLPTVEGRRLTVADVLDLLAQEYRRLGRRSMASLHSNRVALIAALGDVPVTELSYRLLLSTGEAWIADGAKTATVNRRLAALRRGLRIAAKLDLVTRLVEVPQYPEQEPRQGFLEPAEFAQLFPHLPDDGLRSFARWLYASGMRVGEARQLEWRDVQGDTLRVRSSTTKNGRSRQLPLAGQLGTIIAEQRQRRRLECATIFHRDGAPIGEFRAAWRKATKAAGLVGLLVHDLRRSSARNLVRAGVPDRIAMEVTGHRTRSVFDRYNISSADDVRAALTALGTYTEQATADGGTVKVAALNSDNLSESRHAAAS